MTRRLHSEVKAELFVVSKRLHVDQWSVSMKEELQISAARHLIHLVCPLVALRWDCQCHKRATVYSVLAESCR